MIEHGCQCAMGAKCLACALPDKPAPQAADPVHNPSHYTSRSIECIEVTKDFGFCLGNAIKYIWRADLKKDAKEDLAKARWYINYELRSRMTLLEKGTDLELEFRAIMKEIATNPCPVEDLKWLRQLLDLEITNQKNIIAEKIKRKTELEKRYKSKGWEKSTCKHCGPSAENPLNPGETCSYCLAYVKLSGEFVKGVEK